MMLPTHALLAMTLAMPVAFVAPEFSGIAILAGLLGGVFPDLDLYTGHRKVLHYPVYYSVASVPAFLVGGLFPSALTVGVAWFLVGAALHSLTDVLGSGLELRPWEATSERAVYDHYRGQWIAPRRWIRYDGSPGDLVVALLLAVPLLLGLPGQFRVLVGLLLAIAVLYTTVRRLLPAVAAQLVSQILVPHVPILLNYIPARYREATCPSGLETS